MTFNMTPHMLAILLSGSLVSACCAVDPLAAKVDVLDLMQKRLVEYHINAKRQPNDPPEKVFQLQDKLLHISGAGFGAMTTQASFRDYHLVLEFKWGQKTWGWRENRARDNGILVHAYGPPDSIGATFMASIEAQIIEGGMGDILVLGAKLKDGTHLKTSLDCEYELDRDGEKRWKRGAPRRTVLDGRVNWEKRDEDWEDRLGFRGKFDPDAPVGEWNRLEVIARGDTLLYLFNGITVNEGFAAVPSEGRISIQTEGAEMIVRRYELWPLDSFKEVWVPLTSQKP